jgi:DNA-binding response OmpR family regulator
LGLSIARQIVERLGGKIGFDDAPGGGAVFNVDLPAWDGTAGGEIDVQVEPARPRLLLCDDEPIVAQAIRVRLHTAGFAVDFAHTPDTAIQRAAVTRYAAILVDLRLRDSDGIDLILRLRAQPFHVSTPIIVISGDLERGRADVRSPRLKILEWFTKPIDFGRLTETLLSVTMPEPGARPRILHIDQDSDVRALVARELGTMADVQSASCFDDARRMMQGQQIDIVVLDIGLGEHPGLDRLPEFRDRNGNMIPVIVFSKQDAGLRTNEISFSSAQADAPLADLATAVRDRLAQLAQAA